MIVSSLSSHSGEGGHSSKTKIIIGLVVAVSAVAALLAIVAFCLHRRKAERKGKNNINLQACISHGTLVLMFLII